MAIKAAQRLRDRGAKLVAFSDKDTTKWGKAIGGLPVLPPSQLREMPEQPAMLISSTLHDSSIREYLESLGCAPIYSTPYLNYCFPDIFVSREYAGCNGRSL